MKIGLHTKSVRHHAVGRFFLIVAVLTTLMGCRRELPVQLFGEAQGTYYSVQYYDAQRRNLQPQVDSLLDAFDRSASLWVDSSLLRRLNANLTDSLDATLHDLLMHSTEVFHYTEGAFDCCVGPLVQAWGFSFKERSEPDSATLAELLAAAHAPVYINAGIDGHRLVKTNPATELDFNAIAQGYAVDLLARMMDSLGIHNYLIDIGGEVIAHGTKADGRPWRVGIERPSADSLSSPVVQTAIELRDASVVTSGNYRKYYERDGVRYSHTIDPATGRPVRHSLLSVSVVERESWLADAMATAYMVMGLDSALSFIASHPDGPGTKAVFFIYDNGGTLECHATEAFEKLIIQ